MTRAFRIVHAADVHLGSPLRGLRPQPGVDLEAFRRSSRRALSNVVDRCLELDARLLVIAGDLVDKAHRDYTTGLFFVEQAFRLRDAGVPIVMVRGNHDAASRVVDHWMLPDNVTELGLRGPETLRVDDLGVAVHGISYAKPAVFEDLASRYPTPVAGWLNVGVLHTAAEGHRNHDPYAPCRRSQLRAHGYDYWALGHVHTFGVLCRRPWVVFAGNTQARSSREAGPRGAVVIEVGAGRIVEVRHEAMDAVRFERCRIELGDARSIDTVYDAVRVALTQLWEQAGRRSLVTTLALGGSPSAVALLAPLLRHGVPALAAVAEAIGGGRIWIEDVEIDAGEAGCWSIVDRAA